MLDSRIARSLGLAVGLVAGLGALIAPPARADLPPGPPFAVPRDRAEWDARKGELARGLGGGLRAIPPEVMKFAARFAPAEPPATPPGVIAEAIHLFARDDQPKPPWAGLYLRRDRPGAAGRVPLVVLLLDPSPAGTAATAPGWDGRPPASVLMEMGFAVLVFDQESFGSPRGGEIPLQAALDATLARAEVDPARVAVVGLGRTGLTALRLMAMDARVACGIVAVEAGTAAGMWTFQGERGSARVPMHAEEFAALCAPRPLNLMIGEALPLPPGKSVGRAIERAAKGTYRVYGKEGEGRLSFTHYGEFAGHDSVGTRLQWMAAQEWLDKHLRPQGPTPLGHAPEPEPTLDPADKEVLNLTERGIAGWASEMSARDSTWTWRDGVVRCQPGEHEYGWLRCPVAVDDFILTVEWKVPARGNAGIFLRARPVDWALPPTEENKLRVSTLGLTWPSRTGLELQTQDDPGQANRYSTGSLYRHAAPAANPTHSPDRWNRSTVRARGTRVEAWNNGDQVLDADLTRSTDTLPVPPLRGYFGLQNHGAPAEYRAVRLKRLPPGA